MAERNGRAESLACAGSIRPNHATTRKNVAIKHFEEEEAYSNVRGTKNVQPWALFCGREHSEIASLKIFESSLMDMH